MKRQKRDQTERAFTKGYQAGIEGRSRSLCPHETGITRQQWLNGWRESRIDQWDGYNRIAQVQKLNNIHSMMANA
jgi:ribosome modulation factor